MSAVNNDQAAGYAFATSRKASAATSTASVLTEYRAQLEEYAGTLQYSMEDLENELEHVEGEIDGVDAKIESGEDIDPEVVEILKSIQAQIKSKIAQLESLDLEVDVDAPVTDEDEDDRYDDWDDSNEDEDEDEDDDEGYTYQPAGSSVTLTYEFTAPDIDGNISKAQIGAILDDATNSLTILFNTVEVLKRNGDYDAPIATVTVRLDGLKPGIAPAGFPASMIAQSIGAGVVDGVGRVTAKTVQA